MRNRGLQTLNFISTRFKLGNPGIFYDPYSFRFTSRCSGASTRKRTGPPHQGSIFIATFSIYKFNLNAGTASRNSALFWSAKSRSLTDYRKVDQNNVYCFSHCFFCLFFFQYFGWPWGKGGGGARRLHPGGFIFTWPQISIKGIPQYVTGREFRRLGFFKDLWQEHIMAVSFLFFLLDKKTSNQE